ncbi:MAG: hypothetical protein WC784_06550 [Candidatus Shapirobacteria bacterium]|jgi:hypothetical protein
MTKLYFIIAVLLGLCVQLGADPLATSPTDVYKPMSVELRVNVVGGVSANLGGVNQVDGQGVGYFVFNDADYFQGIGRYHLMPSPRAGFDFDVRLNGKNDFLFGFAWDQRILRFDYIKMKAPTDLEYHSDFRYLEFSLGYARNIGKNNYFIGLEWQKNILLYNDSYIRFDSNDYLSVLEDAIGSESVSLFFGRRFALQRHEELNAKLGVYCDTTAMYPLNNNGPIAMVLFLGLSLDVSWSMPAL